MYTFDEIIKANKEHLKEIISRFKEEINKNDFEAVYNKLYNSFIMRGFTGLLLKNKINPLEYMNYIPTGFACTLDIKEFTIPSNIIEIGSYAFEDCANLASIEIPKNVTSIGNRAFFCCSKLKDVYYAGSEEDWKNIKIEQGNGLLIDATIHYNS